MAVGVVLAGGEGRRLRPVVKSGPKALLRLAGKPLYAYSLDELRYSGVRKSVVVAPPGRAQLFRDAPRVVEQAESGSLASAARAAWEEAERTDEDVVVLVFAGFLSAPLGMVESVIDFYLASGFSAVASAVPVVSGLETYGFLALDPSGRVEQVREPGAPAPNTSGGYVFGGVLAATRQAVKMLAEKGFYQGLQALAEEGVLGAVVWHGDWVEIGYPWDLLDALRVALRLTPPVIAGGARIERGAVVGEGVALAKGARVRAGAVVEGPAYIGPGAVIGPNSYISGSIVEGRAEVGCCSYIAESVVLERAVVGNHVSVERSIVGASARLGSYFMAEAGAPSLMPRRLAGLEKILKRLPRVGVAVAESAVIPARSTGEPGQTLGG